jgi:hypothetical protein
VNYNECIVMVLHGFRKLHNENHGLEFFHLLQEFGDSLTPQKIGISGEKYIIYDNLTARDVWFTAGKVYKEYSGISGGGSVDYKGKKPNFYRGNITWDHNGYNDIALYISMKYLKASVGYKKFLELIKKLFIWCNGFYGYSYHPSQSRIHYTPKISYETCIGGITWLTFFGLPYVEMFGRETIKTVPCLVEEIGADQFMLLTSEEPREETAELLAIQECVEKHLGKEVFFRHKEEDKKQKIFTMEEIRQGKDIPDTNGYRAPDFAKYYGKTPSSSMYDTIEEPKGNIGNTENIHEKMQEAAQEAAQEAVRSIKKALKVELDFSEASINDVEKVLAYLYENIKPGQEPTEEDLQGAALVWGAYIGEVLRRNYGGEWIVENGIFALHIANARIYPSSKVYKRLTNGPEDNIAFYYETFKSQLLKQD